MVSLLIIFVLSIIPFFSDWITSPEQTFVESEKLTKERPPIFKRKTSRRLTKRGYLFLGTAVVTTLFASLQYREGEKDKKELRDALAIRDSINRSELRLRDYASRAEQYRRDSLNNEKLKTRDSLTTVHLKLRDSLASVRVEKGKNETITELARYGLKYDSSQQLIAKLVRDSAKKTYIQAADPVLGLCMDKGIEIKKYDEDSLILILRKCAFEAQSKNIDASMYIMANLSDDDAQPNLRFVLKIPFVEPGGEMMAGEQRSMPIALQVHSQPKLRGIVVWVKGTYHNSDYSKVFNIDRVYELHLNSPTLLVPGNPNRIRDFVYRNNFF